MRVRRLHGNDDQTIDLHPRITVVGRADDAVRSWVIESLRALVGPSEPPASGEVEVQLSDGDTFTFDRGRRRCGSPMEPTPYASLIPCRIPLLLANPPTVQSPPPVL